MARAMVCQPLNLRRRHAVSESPLESTGGPGTGHLARALKWRRLRPWRATVRRRETPPYSELFPLGHGQLGGAAADIDVKNSTLSLRRQGDRAGAVGRKQRLEIVARAGAHEIAALRCEDVGDRLARYPCESPRR